jgi:YidC/Oxa1 family membrane protein insertase
MSTEKRLVLFLLLTIASMWAMHALSERLGLIPPPPKPVAKAAAKAEVANAEVPNPAKAGAKAEAPKQAEAPKSAEGKAASPKANAIALAKPGELVLGSTDKSKGYLLEVDLAQEGAGVARIASARFEAELVRGLPRKRPLELIQPDSARAASFSVNVLEKDQDAKNQADDSLGVDVPILSSSELWEVVRDEKGSAVRPTPRGDGQVISFRVTAGSKPPVTLTKTYRLYKGQNGFEMSLRLQTQADAPTVTYKLEGPHGMPLEGEWYTGTFREFLIGQVSGGSAKIDNILANDIAKNPTNPERYVSLPLKFAGVETQYFAVFLEPVPIPASNAEKWDAETYPTLVREEQEKQKSDVSFEMVAKPLDLKPGRPVEHTYRIFAGAKIATDLKPYDAVELASYRKSWIPIPFASSMAQYVISPLLDTIYRLTERVAKVVGLSRGNYGLSIILLTIVVRLCMFPLSRKMAISAKKMQELSPFLREVQEKYKDDKEKITKETFALYKKYGVNPMGGCLPALIQLPIFVGLWQALNNSVALRHASFLWIENLAAPDMLFQFPAELPFLGRYFNLLPFAVVGLMLVQTKLFSPPPTTPEAEMQQKMMKYMMIFMAFMFYKVPSGLGFYFITSSLWQIGERLLLPKVRVAPLAGADEVGAEKAGGKERAGGNGRTGGSQGPSGQGAGAKKVGWFDDLRARMEEKARQLMEEAAHDKTARRDDNAKPSDPGKDRPRPRPGKRR